VGFHNKLSTILEGRNLRPAIIITKRGIVIEADHVRTVLRSSKSGVRKMLVAGVDPGRYEVVHRSCNLSIVKKMRDFYGVPRYILAPGQEDDGSDPNSICVKCQRFCEECRCRHPRYRYDLHRRYVTVRLFRKIFTMDPENIESIRYL